MNKNYSWEGNFSPHRQADSLLRINSGSLKRAIFLTLFLLTSVFWSNIYADGSKDLYPSGVTGNRAYLYSNSYTGSTGSTNTSWPFKTLGVQYVYVKEGETIAAASSAQGLGSGRIRLTAPDGTEYTSAAGTTGQIPDRAGELAGPRYPGQATGGSRYLPYTVSVGAGQEGIWKVEFLPTGSQTSSSTPSVPDVLANANWTQSNNIELISAWDVSVRDADNNNWITGRVYSNVFNLHVSSTSFAANKAFYGKFFVLTRDGIAYRVTNNGSNGVGFTFFVNNKGFLDATENASYKSLNISDPTNTSFRVHDPRSSDDTNNVTHKIFYTTPASDLPATATQAISTTTNVQTWLKNSVIAPTATNVTYTGVEGTVNLSGNKGAYIGFDSNLAGSYRIEIVGSFTTRTITGNCNVGTNTILWDGKDGLGNVLPAGTNIGEIRVQLFGAEVHFPFIDMEINPGGIIIEQLDENYALYSPNRDLVYWDDSNVTGGSGTTKSNPTASGNAGLSSNSNGHKWGNNSASSGSSGNSGNGSFSFGNEKSLDTWSFVPGAIIIKTLNIIVASADLEVESITPSTTTISVGQSVSYTVDVKNNGPSDVSGAGFAFKVPAGFTITNVTYVNSLGVVTVVNGIVDPITGDYTANLDMTNGAEIVFTITGTVGAALGGQPLNVEGSIIRPADVTDIDATNPGITPPSDPHLECLNGTGTESCNNIAYNTLSPLAVSNLSIAKTVDVAVPTIGQQVVFTVAVTNNGPNAATGVTVTDQLPDGFTYVSSNTGSYNPSTGIWTIGTIANGATQTMTITATVNATGNYTNVAVVSGTETDPTPGDNTDDVTSAPNANANLAISKTVNNATPTVGGQVEFSLAVINNGPGDATDVLVTDLLPDGYTYVSHTVGANYIPGTGVWTVGNLVNGASQTLVITATVNATGNYTNTASIDGTENDPDTDDNTDIVTTTPNNVIVANDDSNATPVNGFAGGTAITSVLTNDTLNGTAVVPADVVITVTTPSTEPGVKLDPLTGTVSVDPQTPAGTYTIVYQLCEVLNTTNCDPATVTVTVVPATIIATDDTPAPVNGFAGDTDVTNVLTNDTLNGTAVVPANVVITVTTPSTEPGVKLDPLTGTVSVDPQTPAGTYTIVYQLCEILNATNCDSATVTVIVAPALIAATDDNPASVNGFIGDTDVTNVLTNDTLNGTAVVPANVVITVTTPSTEPGVKLDPLTGTVSVDPQTPAGTYTIVYQLCEVLNATNCDPATVTVTVAPAPIIATDDNPTPVNGLIGDTDVTNVLTNDTLNGTAVVPAEVVITVTTPSTDPGVKLDPLTGTVSVDPQTPAGTYTIVYQLCEVLNATNCDPATVTVTVAPAPIIATDDNPTPVNGLIGDTDITNVLTNDTLNGVAVVPTDVAITVTTPSTEPGVKLDPLTGTVSVDPQTPAGTYTIIYQLCEVMNPGNCDSATATIIVEQAPIEANNEGPVTANGYTGNTNLVDVLTNDTLNGTAVVPSEVAITVTTPATDPGVKLDPLTGTVSVDPQTPAGTYTIVYQLCEILNPGNCDSATATIIVTPAVIDAIDDTPASVNGYTGNPDVVNVKDNDTLNGTPVVPGEVVVTVTTPSTDPGVKLDPLTGTVSVDPQTPAGTYTIVYQLCEVLNPTNCDSATATITVGQAPIEANNDGPVTANGYTGNTNLVDVLTNDTLNGAAVVPSEVAITVTTPSTDPGVKLDPLTGTVSVDPQTPAGTYTIVYQLCEVLNPGNCDSATATIIVTPAVIDAIDDIPASVNGYTGNPDVVNVKDNDTLNGTPVVPGEVVVTVTTPSTDPGVKLDPLTGTVSVDPQTPAGTYTIVYQLCEVLNPTNCDSATATVVVTPAPIDAIPDTPAPVNGYQGNPDVVNVIDNDTLNGVPVTPSEVVITVTTPSTDPGVKLDPLTGTVSIDPQTPAGTYTIVYQLCEILNPTNCDSATATVVVAPAPIDAVNDTPAAVNGYTGNPDVANVKDNDTLNGTPVVPGEVVVTVTTPATEPGVKLDPLTGTVSVDPQTPAGTYTIVYQLCEVLNPTNCDSATATVVVTPAVIDAIPDTPTPVNGYEGNPDVVNVTDNDTLNGVPVTPGEVVITVTTPSTDPGIKLDPLTGTVSVDPQTPAGTYTIVYQLCEILNPTNCDSATATVVVAPAPIDAIPDTPAPVNGYEGNPDVVNVKDNDTLNGTPVVPGEVVVTVTTPSTDPGVKLDPLTGTVSVDPQTPAGTYTIVYQLCEVLNPTNCDSATATIVVEQAPIVANDDANATSVNGYIGNTNLLDVLTNDTLNGVAVIPSEVVITVTTPSADPGVKLDPLTGTVSVDPQTPAGTYTIIYQLCEVLNPGNCDSATATIIVAPAPIDAIPDAPAPVNGYEGNPDVVNVTDNDTLNGVPVTPGEVVITVTTPSTDPGVKLDPLTGTVSVDPQTPAGTYTIVYQLCEVLNPTNCDSATATIVVAPAPIDAVNDTPAPVNGYEGNPDVANVKDNDTLNGVVVTPAEVVITVTTPSTDPGVKLDPLTGTISVDPQTPAGTYTIVYQLCEVLNPGNCDSATATIVVEQAPIVANDDSNTTPVNGYTGDTNLLDVLTNDTLNGVAVVPSEVVITVTTPSADPGVKLDPLTGTVSVDPQTPAGTYTIIYQLCEVLNPGNCDSATATVVVAPASIDAVNDTPAPVNGYIGNPDVANVKDNDTLNGTPVVPSEVVITITTPSTDPGVKLDPLTGTVSVDPQTPAGTYTIVYQLCEVLNPTNCDSATATIVVAPAPIDAVNDTPAPVNGYIGNPNVANVKDNDTLNGVVVTPAEVVITVTTPSTDPGIKLDPLTGTVSVDPQTPAGTYTIVYQLCEVLNPTNCDSATVTVVVSSAVIDAVNDDLSAAIVNGNEGQTNAGNVFNNDMLNGVAVIPAEVILTTVTADAPLALNPDGTITVAPGTTAGTYTLQYSICEALNPTNCDTAIVTIVVQVPAMEIVKQGTFNDANNDGLAQVGETITYNFSVINAGTMQLTNIIISDPLVTVTGGPLAILNAGATDTATFTAVYTFTQADIDAGMVNNQALATATPIVGQPISDQSDSNDPALPGNDDPTVTVLPQDPAFELLKEGTYHDTNNDGIVNVGDRIDYAFTVRNTGNVTITNIIVTDPAVTVSGGPLASLAPLAVDSTTFTASYTITQDDIEVGAVYNIALVEGADSNGDPIADDSSDPSPVGTDDPFYSPDCPNCTVTPLTQTSGIALIKQATFNDNNNDGIAQAGETITYNFTVTNTGNVTLTNVSIQDPLPGIIVSGGPITLGVGETDTTSFSAVYAITQADINTGSVSNQALVTGTSPLGAVVTDQSDDNDNVGNDPTVTEVAGCQLKIFNAVSPDGDGINDIFYIAGIECYPNNEVMIFNRWGVQVFDTKGYDNNSKAFRGISEGRTTVSKSEELPVGTYFYVIELTKADGSKEKKDGYLYINR